MFSSVHDRLRSELGLVWVRVYDLHVTLTYKVQGLDLGSYGNGELVLSRNGECPVPVTELSQDVDLRHVVPDGFHQLQMGRLNALKQNHLQLLKETPAPALFFTSRHGNYLNNFRLSLLRKHSLFSS